MDNFGKINKRVVLNKRVGRKVLGLIIIMQERKRRKIGIFNDR